MIFVTGGTGMVGAHLLLRLVQKGESVRALRRTSANMAQVEKVFEWYGESAKFDDIEWVDGDICDLFSLQEALRGVNVVYHAAAIVSFEKKRRLEILENNRVGTANLVDVALTYGIQKFCHVSSSASLGDAPEGMMTDESCIWNGDANRSNYSKSKYLSEMEVWRGHTEGLEMVIVNPSVILGAGNWESGSPKFFSTVEKGMKFYTSGGTGIVDVFDVVDAMIALTSEQHWEQVKNERYVLNAENVLYRDLFSMIADHLQKSRPTILAGDFLLELGWRLSTLLNTLKGKPASLTKESARSSKSISQYSNTKISEAIDFRFRPIEKTIEQIASVFRTDADKKTNA